MKKWRYISGYNNKYKVNNFGDVHSLISNIILKEYVEKNGYARVTLFNNSGRKKISVHRITLCAFTDKRLDYCMQVNHVDGNKLNNRLDNLEWVSGSENIKHAHINNLKPSGSDMYNSNCRSSDILEIVNYLRDTRLSCGEISKKTGLTSRISVSRINNGQVYKRELRELGFSNFPLRKEPRVNHAG